MTKTHFPTAQGVAVYDGKNPPKIISGAVRVAELPEGDWHMRMVGAVIYLIDRSGKNAPMWIKDGEIQKLEPFASGKRDWPTVFINPRVTMSGPLRENYLAATNFADLETRVAAQMAKLYGDYVVLCSQDGVEPLPFEEWGRTVHCG